MAERELGVIYAAQENNVKANEMISALGSLKVDYDYGQTPYLQGKIQAHLGNVEAALRYLRIAIDEGMKFEAGNGFQHDPDLMILNSNPEYQRLLVRNRQHPDDTKNNNPARKQNPKFQFTNSGSISNQDNGEFGFTLSS